MFLGSTFETVFLAFGTSYRYLKAAWIFPLPLSVMVLQWLRFHTGMKGGDQKMGIEGRAKRHPRRKRALQGRWDSVFCLIYLVLFLDSPSPASHLWIIAFGSAELLTNVTSLYSSMPAPMLRPLSRVLPLHFTTWNMGARLSGISSEFTCSVKSFW